MIAKPKNKSLSKSDKTFPFLCKPKTKCGREGKRVTFCWKLLLFWMVSHSHCEKAFLPSLFHITHSSRHPAFMVLVHSKVTAILSLCDISCEPAGSILTTGLGTCVKKFVQYKTTTHSFKPYWVRCSFCRDCESCRKFFQKFIQIVFFLLWNMNLMFVICDLFTNWRTIRKMFWIIDWSCMGRLLHFANTFCL